jgi:hypothetical protein
LALSLLSFQKWAGFGLNITSLPVCFISLGVGFAFRDEDLFFDQWKRCLGRFASQQTRAYPSATGVIQSVTLPQVWCCIEQIVTSGDK